MTEQICNACKTRIRAGVCGCYEFDARQQRKRDRRAIAARLRRSAKQRDAEHQEESAA